MLPDPYWMPHFKRSIVSFAVPLTVFLSVVIGAGMFGILGAFLALPVAASIPVLIKYAEKMQKSRSSQKIKTIEK